MKRKIEIGLNIVTIILALLLAILDATVNNRIMAIAFGVLVLLNVIALILRLKRSKD